MEASPQIIDPRFDPGRAAAVDETAFEARLQAVAAAAPSEAEGIFGPHAPMWGINRESLIFLGAGAASLLQLAHPWVAAAIAAHSSLEKDPVGRFHRTFVNVFAMTFGPVSLAVKRARAVHRGHGAIAGPGYAANRTEPLLWVHSTLWVTAGTVYERIFGPLPEVTRNGYARDGARLAGLFGVPEADCPSSWTGFHEQFTAHAAAPHIRPSDTAKCLARFLLWEKPGGVPSPRWQRDITAALLPPHLREGFGLPWDAETETRSDRIFRRVASVSRALPPALRYVGPYHEAQARLQGRPRPGPVTRRLNRFWIGQETLTG